MFAHRAVIAAIFTLALIAAGAASIWFSQETPPPPPGGKVTGLAAIGGPFHLIDDRDRPVTDADLRGKPSVLFFGFTYCPDVCPTTLARLSGFIEQLGPDADKLNYAFITVDPERDTPAQLHSYLASFDPRIRGLTGSTEQVDQMVREYRIYAKRVPTSDGGYTMDHTASIYMMDAEGRFAGTIDISEPDRTGLGKLRNLIQSSGAAGS